MPAKPQILNSELRSELVHYKNSTLEEREKIRASWKKKVADLPAEIKTNKQAINAYQTMAYATQVAKYADILFNMENKLPFDILNDYTNMGPLFEKDEFKALKQYFRFVGRQLALTVSPNEVPLEIWQLFQAAQLQHRVGKDNQPVFTLDLAHPAADQLFPIQIQGLFAGAENHAVDRVYATKQGQFRFANNYGYYSPGGGMVAPGDNSDDEAVIIEQMLIEHLEEEHANLHLKAGTQYNLLDRHTFCETISRGIASKKVAIDKMLGNNTEFSDLLNQILNTGFEEATATNTDILKRLIAAIDLRLSTLEAGVIKKDLYTLRAEIQVATFKLTQTYADALTFVKANTESCIIEQFLDTRALGGKQFAHTYMMTGQALEDWFHGQFPDDDNNHLEYGDDLTGAVSQRLSFLQLLALKPANIKFSHVLIPLEYTKMAFKKELFNVNDVWNNEDYVIARAAVIGSVASAAVTPLLTHTLRDADNRDDENFNRAVADVVQLAKDNGAPFGNHLLQLANEAIAFQGSSKHTRGVEALSVEGILRNTVLMMSGEIDTETYTAQAKAIQEGKLSPGLIAFGSIMLAICALAIAAGIVVFTLPVAAAALSVSAVVGASAAAGTATVTGVAGGLGLFGGQQRGLSKAACELAKDAKAYDDVQAKLEA